MRVPHLKFRYKDKQTTRYNNTNIKHIGYSTTHQFLQSRSPNLPKFTREPFFLIKLRNPNFWAKILSCWKKYKRGLLFKNVPKIEKNTVFVNHISGTAYPKQTRPWKDNLWKHTAWYALLTLEHTWPTYKIFEPKKQSIWSMYKNAPKWLNITKTLRLKNPKGFE